MRRSIERLALALAIPAALAAAAALPAQQETTRTDHAAKIKTLSDQLRPHTGDGGLEHYIAIKDAVSKDLLSEIDAYIAESFPADSSAAQVKAGLDATLGYKEGDLEQSIVFLTNLPAGRFLIVGIELPGAGTSEREGYGDSVCFRAYAESGGKFTYTASTGDLSNSALYGLNAQVLKVPPVAGQFWFVAWADVPPLSPYKIAAQLYAFDGKSFFMVWEPEVFISSSIDDAVQLASNGDIVINRMPDFQSQIILHQQYAVTADGPQKIIEWTTLR